MRFFYWKSIRNKLAFSLAEVLVATALLAILLAAIGNICVDGIRALKKGQNRVSTQQEALISIDRLCRELKETHSDTITLIYSNEHNGTGDSEFDAISLGTAKDNVDASENTRIQPDGEFYWMRYIVYSKKVGETDVYRTVLDLYGPKNEFAPSPLNIGDVKDGIKNLLGAGIMSHQKKIARDIYLISFTEQTVTPVVRGIDINVTARVLAGYDKTTGTELYETTQLTTFVKPWK